MSGSATRSWLRREATRGAAGAAAGMDSSAHTCLSYPRFIYALSITPGLVTRCRPVWVIFRTLKIEASRNLGIPPGLRCQSADQFLGWPPASWLVLFREHLVSIGDTKLAGRH